MKTDFDVIVLGAGAAGLMCAISAGRRGRRILVLDHADQPGKKILISGGGRCNFTNTGTAPERFLSENPNFARSALRRYQPQRFINLVQKHNIAFHEKTLGQLFCDGSARAIVEMLMKECAEASVQFGFSHRITKITRDERFHIATDHGEYNASSLVLATGGISIPKMGATGFAYETAKQFGLRVVEPRPGLVPLIFEGETLAMMQSLAGLSLPVEARLGKAKFPESLLFTHRGLSGPAVLQISSYWRGSELAFNLLPGQDAATVLLERKRTHARTELHNVLSDLLPHRLAQIWTKPGQRMADLPDRTLRAEADRLSSWRLVPSGTEGFAKAEVTCGGIDTNDLSSRTLMANDVPGLFTIGEAVDVTGWLGGYNFQWAWASGWCAGEAA